MPIKETTPLEVDATFLRLTKIFWSQSWRMTLCIIPILLAVFAYGAFSGLEIDQIDKMESEFFKFSFSPKYIAYISLIYLLYLLTFRLIIELKFSDFSFSFDPSLGKKSSEFWQALSLVSWAYFWRTSILLVGHDLAEKAFPHIFEMSSVKLMSSTLEIALCIYLLRFVVNKQYGTVRLSLLKQDKEVTP